MSVIPGGQPSAAALEDLGEVSSSPQKWTVNQPEGTSVTFKLVDSTGAIFYSDQVTVMKGSSSDCLGKSAVVESGDSSSASTGASSAAASAASAPASSAGSSASKVESESSAAATSKASSTPAGAAAGSETTPDAAVRIESVGLLATMLAVVGAIAL